MAFCGDNGIYFDIKQLQLLDILYATRSVSKTAERMGQSQPMTSVLLRQIREKVGDPLFIRTSKEMVPTPRAESVVRKAREALDSIRQICDDVPRFNPGVSYRTFRICVPDSSHITFIPKLLNYVSSVAPTVKFETLPVNHETPMLLENGEVDLARGGFVPGMDTGFHQQTLYKQDFICLAKKGHPRITETLTLEDYQRESHIAVSYGVADGVNALITKALQSQYIERRVQLTLSGFLGIGATIATTELIATLPRTIGETLAANHGLQVLKCPVQFPTYMVMQYWHSRYHREPGNQWLRKLCSEITDANWQPEIA